MLDRYLPLDRIPSLARRVPGFVEALDGALRASWNDGFRTGLTAALSAVAVLGVAVLFAIVLRRK